MRTRVCGACTGATGSGGGTRGSRVGRSPPAPLPRAHMSVCTGVYIYIFVFIYIHTFTRFRHTPVRRRPQVPPRRVPPVPTRVPARTRLHTCVPACRCTPGPLCTHGTGVRPTGVHGPPSTCTGGAWVPPKAITPPQSVWVQRGDPPAPAGTNQRVSAHGGPSPAPTPCPPQPGWGGPLHPAHGLKHPGGGGQPERNFGFSLGFFF